MDESNNIILTHIQDWKGRGIISEDTADRLMLDIQSGKKASPFVENRIVKIITVIGSLLVGLGICLFIASNWKAMSDSVKVIIIFLGLIAMHAAGIYAKLKLPNSVFPNVFHLIATFVFAGGIFLLGQIFHINGDASDAFFWIMIGALPLAYAVNSRPILATGLAFGYAWLLRLLFLDHNLGQFYTPVLVLIGLSIYFWGEITHLLGIKNNLTETYRNIGALTVLGTTFVATFTVRWVDHTAHIPPALFFAALVFIVMMAVILRLKRSEKIQQLYPFGIIAVILLFVTMQTLYIPDTRQGLFEGGYGFFTPESIIANISLIASITLFFMEGVQKKLKSLINIALVGIILTVIARYVDFASFLDRSIAFIFGGILLLGVGWFLEKKRRELFKQFEIQK